MGREKNPIFFFFSDFGTLIGRGSEQPLNQLPIYKAVINSQHMKLRICSHPHFAPNSMMQSGTLSSSMD